MKANKPSFLMQLLPQPLTCSLVILEASNHVNGTLHYTKIYDLSSTTYKYACLHSYTHNWLILIMLGYCLFIPCRVKSCSTQVDCAP